MDILAQLGLEAMRDGNAMLDQHGIEVDWDDGVAPHKSNGRWLISNPQAFGRIYRIISRRYCAALTPENRTKQKNMSTHALTVYRSREFDGETVHEVGHFFRKFDGQPTGHGRHLKLLLQGKKFTTLWELVGAVANGLRIESQGRNYNWSFVPVAPQSMDDIEPEYIYRLSLVDKCGEMPRGNSADAHCDVHIAVTDIGGRELYSGLLNDYVPEA
jgi:hypothetical protein